MPSRLSNLIPLMLIILLTVLTAIQAAVLDNVNPSTQLSPTARLVKGEEPSPATKSVLRQNPTPDNFDQVVFSLLSERLEPSPEQNDILFQLHDPDTLSSPLETQPPAVVLTIDDDLQQAKAIPPRADGDVSASTNNTTPGPQQVVFQLGPQSDQQSTDDFVTLTVNDVEQDEPQPSPLAEESQPSIFAALPSLTFDDDAFLSPDASETEMVFASPMPTDEPQFSAGFAPSLSVDAQSDATSRVEISLSVTSSTAISVSEAFDKQSRAYFANSTNTDASDWKAVFISAAKQVEERETKRVQWGVQYQGTVPSEQLSETVQSLQDDIARGGLENRLRAAVPSAEDVTVQLSDAIKVNVEDRAAANVQAIGAVNSGVSNENAATGASAEELSSGSNNSSPTRSRNLGVILGTCLGLLAVVVLSVAVFLFARSRSQSPRHTIDGEEMAPPTLTSIQSLSTDTTTSRFHTGAPVNPRGVTILRNQSRLLDWRMNQAATAGRTYGTPMGHNLPETQE